MALVLSEFHLFPPIFRTLFSFLYICCFGLTVKKKGDFRCSSLINLQNNSTRRQRKQLFSVFEFDISFGFHDHCLSLSFCVVDLVSPLVLSQLLPPRRWYFLLCNALFIFSFQYDVDSRCIVVFEFLVPYCFLYLQVISVLILNVDSNFSRLVFNVVVSLLLCSNMLLLSWFSYTCLDIFESVFSCFRCLLVW